MANSSMSASRKYKLTPTNSKPFASVSQPDFTQSRTATELALKQFISDPNLARPEDLLGIQRTLGNRAVNALLTRPMPEQLADQAQLMVNAAGDKYEQEADRVAEQTVQMPTLQLENPAQNVKPSIMRMPDNQRTGGAAFAADEKFTQQLNTRKGQGQSLPFAIKGELEAAFGADFSDVRIHADAQADAMSSSIQAKAFTVGHDIFFRQGSFQPESLAGQRMIAHELTHVVQQNGVKESQTVIQRLYLDEQQPLPLPIESLQSDIKAYKTSRSLMEGFNHLTALQSQLQKLSAAGKQELRELEAEVKKERNLLGQLTLIGSNIQYCLFGSKKDSYRKLSSIADISAHIPIEDIQGSYALNLVLDLHKLLPQLVNAIYQLAHLEGKTEAWALSVQNSIVAKIQKDIGPAFAAIQMPITLPETKPAEIPGKTEQSDEIILTEPDKAADQRFDGQEDELSDEDLAAEDASAQQKPSLNNTSINTENTNNDTSRQSSPVIPPPSPPVLADVASSEELSEAEMTEEKTRNYHAHSKTWYGNGDITGTGVQLIRTLAFNPSVHYAVKAAPLLQKGGDFQHGIFWEGKVLEIAPGSSQAVITSEHQISLPVPEQANFPKSSVWTKHTEFFQASMSRSEEFSAIDGQVRALDNLSGTTAEKLSEISAVKQKDLTVQHEAPKTKPEELAPKLNTLATGSHPSAPINDNNATRASLSNKPAQPVSSPILDKPGNTAKSPEIVKPFNTNTLASSSTTFGFTFFDDSEQNNIPAIEAPKTTGLNNNGPPQTTMIPSVKTTSVPPSQLNKPTTAAAPPQPALANPLPRVLPHGSVTGNHGLTVSPAMIRAIRQDIMTCGIDSKWADQHEIKVLASVLGVKIIVHYPNGPSSENGDSNDIYELYHNGKDHYDVKLPYPGTAQGFRKKKIPGDGDCFYKGIVTIASDCKNRNFSVLGLRRIVHDNLTDEDIADIALPLIEDFKSGLTNPSRLDGIGLRFKILMRNRQQSGILHYSDT